MEESEEIMGKGRKKMVRKRQDKTYFLERKVT